MQTFLSLLPILILVGGLLLFKNKLKISALISLFAAIILSTFYLHTSYQVILSSLLKGAFVSLDIVLIVFGALTFLYLMQKADVISSLETYLHKISPDIRVQTILLAWFFGAFLESTAGFGIPALIVAYLLLRTGIKPIWAVVIALVANSAPVTFGAVGTPIKIGFHNFNMQEIAQNTVELGAIVGVFVPLMVLAILTYALKKPVWQFFIKASPFAIFSGLCFVIPYYFGLYLGLEFPSIAGATIGTAVVLLALKLGLFKFNNDFKIKDPSEPKVRISPTKALMPYALLVSLLIIAKLIPLRLTAEINENISHTFVLFNPGTIFLISAVVIIAVSSLTLRDVFKGAKEAFVKIPYIATIIFLVVGLMQVMVNSQLATQAFKNLETPLLPLLSPFIGAFGAFIAGSATVSNLLFGPAQAHAAEQAGINISIILSLQLLGATAGNMISIPNIIAAQTAVDLKGKERHIIKKIIPWSLLYILLVLAAAFFAI
ncbi:MAG: L-lactate permease [Candidatus Curtissbacteria bacterium]|nr:L-lactate permease [Candidatus Curtissbacteria bacterium]